MHWARELRWMRLAAAAGCGGGGIMTLMELRWWREEMGGRGRSCDHVTTAAARPLTHPWALWAHHSLSPSLPISPSVCFSVSVCPSLGQPAHMQRALCCAGCVLWLSRVLQGTVHPHSHPATEAPLQPAAARPHIVYAACTQPGRQTDGESRTFRTKCWTRAAGVLMIADQRLRLRLYRRVKRYLPLRTVAKCHRGITLCVLWDSL